MVLLGGPPSLLSLAQLGPVGEDLATGRSPTSPNPMWGRSNANPGDVMVLGCFNLFWYDLSPRTCLGHPTKGVQPHNMAPRIIQVLNPSTTLRFKEGLPGDAFTRSEPLGLATPPVNPFRWRPGVMDLICDQNKLRQCCLHLQRHETTAIGSWMERLAVL